MKKTILSTIVLAFVLCWFCLQRDVIAEKESAADYTAAIATFARRCDPRVLRIVDRAIQAGLRKREADPKFDLDDRDAVSLLNHIQMMGLDTDPEPMIENFKSNGDEIAAWQDWQIRHGNMKPRSDRDQRKPIKGGIKSEPNQ